MELDAFKLFLFFDINEASAKEIVHLLDTTPIEDALINKKMYQFSSLILRKQSFSEFPFKYQKYIKQVMNAIQARLAKKVNHVILLFDRIDDYQKYRDHPPLIESSKKAHHEGTYGKVFIDRNLNLITKISEEGSLLLREIAILDYFNRLVYANTRASAAPFIIRMKSYSILPSYQVHIVEEYLPLTLNYFNVSYNLHVTADEFNTMINQFIQAITLMHQHRICHLDIKPPNTVYDRAQKTLKLIDFNAANPLCYYPEMNNLQTVIGHEGMWPPEAFICQKISCENNIKKCYDSSIDVYNMAWTLLFVLSEGHINLFRTVSEYKPNTVQAAKQLEKLIWKTMDLTKITFPTLDEWNENIAPCAVVNPQNPLHKPFVEMFKKNNTPNIQERNHRKYANDNIWPKVEKYLQELYKDDVPQQQAKLKFFKSCLSLYAHDRPSPETLFNFETTLFPSIHTSTEEFITLKMSLIPEPILQNHEKYGGVRDQIRQQLKIHEDAMLQRDRSVIVFQVLAKALSIYDYAILLNYPHVDTLWSTVIMMTHSFYEPESFRQLYKSEYDIIMAIIPFHENDEFPAIDFQHLQELLDLITPARLLGLSFIEYVVLKHPFWSVQQYYQAMQLLLTNEFTSQLYDEQIKKIN